MDLWGRRGGSEAAGGLISGEAGGLGGVRAGCAGGTCEGGWPGCGVGRGESCQGPAAGLVGWWALNGPWLEVWLPWEPVVRPWSWGEGCRGPKWATFYMSAGHGGRRLLEVRRYVLKYPMTVRMTGSARRSKALILANLKMSAALVTSPRRCP